MRGTTSFFSLQRSRAYPCLLIWASPQIQAQTNVSFCIVLPGRNLDNIAFVL